MIGEIEKCGLATSIREKTDESMTNGIGCTYEAESLEHNQKDSVSRTMMP